MLFAGCAGRVPTVAIDPTIPHEVAERVEVKVWARRADGRMQAVRIYLDPGWWVASPLVIEGESRVY